ncbi:hypothetical protein K8R20_01170 [bacterium]|nr:hypothetical protein [bacterium]
MLQILKKWNDILTTIFAIFETPATISNMLNIKTEVITSTKSQYKTP